MAKAQRRQPGGAREITAATTPESKPEKTATSKPARGRGSRKRPGVKKRATMRKRAAKSASSAPDTTPTPRSPASQGPADQKQAPERPSGGQGDGTILVEDGHHDRADMRMVAGAMRRRIPIRPEVLEACLNRAARIGLSTPHERHALMAARLLLTAEQINQADEHKGMPDKLQVEAVQPMTADMQRHAILAAIAAERRKREEA